MGKVNFGMNIYIMEKEKLIRIVDDAFVHGYSYFTRDLMATNTDSLNIQAYEYTGYASQITDMKSYFEENMKLLDEDNRKHCLRLAILSIQRSGMITLQDT